jgi:hypothetical protein
MAHQMQYPAIDRARSRRAPVTPIHLRSIHAEPVLPRSASAEKWRT